MSNQLVGTVFDRVIQEVCDASQVDFEESGVDQQTLLDLRKSWQKKLSSLGVAHFPWDPPPPQPAPAQNQNQILPPTATVPSNAPRPPQPSPTQHVPPQPLPQSVPASVPPLQVPAPVGPSASMHDDVSPAKPPVRTRTSGQLSPSAIWRCGCQLAHAERPRHPIKQEPGYPPLSHPSVGNSQTDGASGDALSEWKAEVTRRREAAEQQDGEGDRALREHLRQRILQFEGGGLMLPLEEQQSSSSRGLTSNLSSAESKVPRAQFDGPGGDDTKDEDDEDAINSDLDDPDDLVAEDHDAEDAVGQVMLCTYDKVQRVKNKWKCTLKDGILTTGGKEYVFHKGQGEFEW
ncbi:hypothetical protein AOCH_005086 [Aspergillus ochraceoroseus]|uniref:Transcription initiation factor IIA large subunit n=1 Tax=Aspergillus ochraceoroseus TaxID=138278 RepID=A0A0F8WNA1_9EURO|nr:hypothetical protein AOCH_005086 [Aspergillus ochraceoroseus]